MKGVQAINLKFILCFYLVMSTSRAFRAQQNATQCSIMSQNVTMFVHAAVVDVTSTTTFVVHSENIVTFLNIVQPRL